MSSTLASYKGHGEMFYGSGDITIAAIVPEASADYTISDANAVIGQVVNVSIENAGMEASLVVMAAWVSAAGTISIRIGNHNASGGANLTGSTSTVYYTLTKI